MKTGAARSVTWWRNEAYRLSRLGCERVGSVVISDWKVQDSRAGLPSARHAYMIRHLAVKSKIGPVAHRTLNPLALGSNPRSPIVK